MQTSASAVGSFGILSAAGHGCGTHLTSSGSTREAGNWSAPNSSCLPGPPTPRTLPAFPPPLVHSGGLRADEARDFRLEVTTDLCRAPGDTELTCLRDLDVLDEPLETRIGIAPDVALLIQDGTVIGWSLTDPARYLTTAFAAPDPAPPPRPPGCFSPNAWT